MHKCSIPRTPNFPVDTISEQFHNRSIEQGAPNPTPAGSALDPQAQRLLLYLDILVNRFLSARFPKNAQVPDVGPADFRMLTLVQQAGSMTMTDLAEKLDLPLSTATNRVDRLVKLDLLTRVRSDLDRRIVEIQVSGLGRDVVAAGLEVQLSMGRGMLAVLTPGEREILIELMQKMSERATV